jgi:hypothetical protein
MISHRLDASRHLSEQVWLPGFFSLGHWFYFGHNRLAQVGVLELANHRTSFREL